ncbi:MAG: response regulator transcription factor [Candidatus Limnocylindrales bacterium]
MTDDSPTAPEVPGSQISVAIVDDHPVLRDGIASLLRGQPDLRVLALGDTVADAEAILAAGDADVLLLDVRLGTQSGLTALQGKRAERPAVVVLTAYDYPQYAEAALRLGASGFVLKNGPIEDLLAAIRAAAAGGIHFGLRPGTRLALSQRELDVVRLIVDGRSNDEIAAELEISAKTVESHLRRIFERVGVVSRTELATRALREGWLDLPIDDKPATAR